VCALWGDQLKNKSVFVKVERDMSGDKFSFQSYMEVVGNKGCFAVALLACAQEENWNQEGFSEIMH
jgi:hypothetical protein